MRKPLLFLVPVIFAACARGQGFVLNEQGVTLAKNIEQIRYVDDANTAGWAGADVCAQEQSAEADLPSYGGTIDMSGLAASTFYACAGTWTIGASKPVVLYLPIQTIVITPTGNNPKITITTASKIIGSNSANNYSPGGSSRLQSGGGAGDLIRWTASSAVMEDVGLVEGGAMTALHMVASASSGQISRNYLRNVQVSCDGTAGSIGFELTGYDDNDTITFDKFEAPLTQQCDRDFQTDTANSQGPTDIYVDGFNFESSVGRASSVGINLTGATTASIHFAKGHINTPNGTNVKIAPGVYATTFEQIRSEGPGMIDVIDAGIGTTFNAFSFSNCQTSTIAASSYMYGGWSNTNCLFDQFPRGLAVLSLLKSGKTSVNTGTGPLAGVQILGASFANLDFESASAGADGKWWDLVASSGEFDLRLVNDANNSTLNLLHFTRNGMSATGLTVTPPATFSSTISVGNGSVINKILNGTATLNFGTVNAQTCAEQPITIRGASTANFGVFASPQLSLGSINLSWSAWVSRSNIVSVRVCNPSVVNVAVNAVAWGATVNQ